MSTIPRKGTVRFTDAAFSVWEEMDGLGSRSTFEERAAWEKKFKKEVFSRVVQQLNRLGWTCVVPVDYIRQYGLRFAQDRRKCQKGDLKGFLEITGRTIEFKMWQEVANITHPSGGKYEFNKESLMPYLLRLEMERTRRRIRDYLCGVFESYAFQPQEPKMGVDGLTAMEYAAYYRKKTGHYVAELDRASFSNPGDNLSKDGIELENGMRVYAQDWNGRMVTGLAFYDLNGNWTIVTGRYGLARAYHNLIWVNNPGKLRERRDTGQRRKRLEGEMAKAIKSMNFERAAILRDVLYPKDTPLFVVLNEKDDLYHRPNFQGYTKELVDAGKFTAEEVKGYTRAPNKVISLSELVA